MESATLEQTDKTVYDNILNYPLYQRVIKSIKSKFFLSGVRDEIIPSSKAIRFISVSIQKMLKPPSSATGKVPVKDTPPGAYFMDRLFKHRVTDLMDSLSANEGRRALKTEEGMPPIKMKTKRIVQAMTTNTPVEGDAEEASPLATLGLYITLARRERNLSVEDLATKTKLDFETLFLIENGLASMDLVSENLEKICNAVDLDYHRTSSYIIDLILK